MIIECVEVIQDFLCSLSVLEIVNISLASFHPFYDDLPIIVLLLAGIGTQWDIPKASV